MIEQVVFDFAYAVRDSIDEECLLQLNPAEKGIEIEVVVNSSFGEKVVGRLPTPFNNIAQARKLAELIERELNAWNIRAYHNREQFDRVFSITD